jgi:hypothetical protein
MVVVGAKSKMKKINGFVILVLVKNILCFGGDGFNDYI